MHYYVVLSELLNSLSSEVTTRTAMLVSEAESFSSMVSQCELLYETLVRLYFSRHSFEMANMMLVYFLTNFALSAINKLGKISHTPNRDMPRISVTAEPETPIDALRSIIVLAERVLSNQGHCYYFAQSAFHIILSQLQRDDATFVRRFADVPEENENARQLLSQHMQSQYPMHSVHAVDQRQEHMDALVRQYAGQTLEQTCQD